MTPRRKNVTFIPLMDTELPKAETVIGLDTEFVTLNQVGRKFINRVITVCNFMSVLNL